MNEVSVRVRFFEATTGEGEEVGAFSPSELEELEESFKRGGVCLGDYEAYFMDTQWVCTEAGDPHYEIIVG